MTFRTETDLTLPLIPEAARQNRGPVPAAAYVPIAVAIIGVALILVGGIKSHGTAPQVAGVPPTGIDTIVTGAVKTRDARHDIEWLDR
jgi:hypothetical protein